MGLQARNADTGRPDVSNRDAAKPLDINRDTAQEIDELPALAGHGFEIVRYREDRGAFTALRQLDEVPGMAGKLSDADRATLTL